MAVDLNRLSRSARERVTTALDAYNHAADLVRELAEDGVSIMLTQTREQGWEIVQVTLAEPDRQKPKPPPKRQPYPDQRDVGIDIGGEDT